MIEVLNIFIVEDDISLQRLYKCMLNIKGFHIIGVAYNGEDAINKFKTFIRRPDIILMDYRMPIKNGLEATTEIIKIDHKANIIFASADSEIINQALILGAKSFLLKPFSYEQLIWKLNHILG